MIRVVVDDLAFVEADALVRPTSALLEPVSAALRGIERVGGPAFLDQIATHGELAVGSAVVTGGGELAADFVVHAVVRSQDEPVTAQHVRRALLSVLQRSVDWQLATVAMPPLGVGPGSLEIDDAARVMVEVLHQGLQTAEYPRDVVIVVNSEDDRQVFESYLRRTPQ